MPTASKLDCLLIGYNEIPFQAFEAMVRETFGIQSEVYRDLRFNFVHGGAAGKLRYIDLLNHVLGAGGEGQNGGDGAAQLYRSSDVPNLAAVYLASYLRRRGLEAQWVNHFQYGKEQLAEALAADPVCVAITTTLYVFNLPASEIVEFIREHNPRVPIVVGGPLIANHARSFEGDRLAAALKGLGADFYVNESQGEETLYRLVRCLKQGGDPRSVPNLLYFGEDGSLCTTAVAPEFSDLDREYVRWTDFSDLGLGPTIQIRTARSCAFKCSFCNYPTRGGKLTLASLDTIRHELDSIRRLGGVENVVFIDDTFNVPLPRFKEICRLIKKEKYEFGWYSYFRCSNADEECVELMSESGCKGVFLGIESGSPTILDNMNKVATIEQYVDGIEWLHRHDILTFASFIIGFPGETPETIAETLDFIERTAPDYYRTQLWYCEPGTPIHRQRQRWGIEGEGFDWRHGTMTSVEAMEHIESMFETITASEWLPKHGFDFWIIPYLAGKGMSRTQFKDFMVVANRMMAMEVLPVPEPEKAARVEAGLAHLRDLVRGWNAATAVPGA